MCRDASRRLRMRSEVSASSHDGAGREPEANGTCRQRLSSHRPGGCPWKSPPVESEKFREQLIKLYGEERGKKVKYAESFELCEYGRRPSPEDAVAAD